MIDESVTDAAYRSVSRGRLSAWHAAAAVPASRAARVRRLLVDSEPRIRPLLKAILALRLDGPSDDPVLRALGNLKGCYDFPPA